MKITISARYGSIDSAHATSHTGVDIAVPQGTPIHSIQSGYAHIVNYGDNNIGKGIIVHQSDGTDAIYGHLSAFKVHEGEYVMPGETIGLSGSTGNSTGPHLHLGLKDHGHFVDPTPYADEAINSHMNWFQAFFHNGKVGDGFHDLPNHNVWMWLYEKITVDSVTHFLANFLTALPLIAVVSFGVYALIGMVSKKGAKLGVLITFVYGALLSQV